MNGGIALGLHPPGAPREAGADVGSALAKP